MKTMCSSAPTHNPSVKGTSCGKPQAAPYVERFGHAISRRFRPSHVTPTALPHHPSSYFRGLLCHWNRNGQPKIVGSGCRLLRVVCGGLLLDASSPLSSMRCSNRLCGAVSGHLALFGVQEN